MAFNFAYIARLPGAISMLGVQLVPFIAWLSCYVGLMFLMTLPLRILPILLSPGPYTQSQSLSLRMRASGRGDFASGTNMCNRRVVEVQM